MRTNLCFHSAIRGLLTRRTDLVKTWTLGVALAAVGLTGVFALSDWTLNRGLAFRPVANLGGGLVFGVGMVVAASCASGLFYKLGSGMVGAAVGIGGWAAGQLAGDRLDFPGPTLLPHGDEATLAGWLGLPRAAVAIPLAVLVIFGMLLAGRGSRDWTWIVAGTGLGAATILGWVLAGLGGASFGPSTIGAVNPAVAGDPNLWLTAFLVAMIAGAAIAARGSGDLLVRGESNVRYVQLAIGGGLLGIGGVIAGGCNLGHGVSGAAQLSISSFVMIAGMIGGVALAAAARKRIAEPLADWRPSST